ncbi:DUF3343 domain-containing protein [Clostridium sp.]|uniref:DUF3343 domain-containing protein n=1 Tax=Clostridium sp. TaxID=1506 RepID=UPI00261E2448|nr:DUF3343 domain-containing protein [Clostridium sp.]
MKDFIMVFNNTHEAMEGERILKENGVIFIIMPTPTYITKSCGISAAFNKDQLEKIETLKIKFKNIYSITSKGFEIYK